MTDTHIDSTIEFLLRFDEDDHYIKMAVSWAVCEVLTKYYGKGVQIIESKSLSVWVHNKAIQKACDSYRITDEAKGYLRRLRR